MFLVCYLRRYFGISIICLSLTGLLPEAHAEKRIFASVDPNAGSINSGVEIYDPATGTITSLPPSAVTTRESHTAILLNDGRVFFTGGYNGAYLAGSGVYDPATGTFTGTGLMESARSNHSAVLLQTGKVFVAGGFNGGAVLDTAELYDPSAESFASVGSVLTAARYGHTATLLADGKVLLTGGYNGSYLNSAELFDPATDTFSSTSGIMTVGRLGHTATRLSDGKVLIVGGQNAEGYVSSAEIYDPATDKFTATSGPMAATRKDHIATLLSSGKVLIAGGFNGAYLNTAEIYDPATGKFTATSSPMTAARSGHAACILGTGKVLISGGYNGSHLKSIELFDSSSGSFTAQPASMAVAREFHASTVLQDGTVLITGGQNTDLLTFDVNSSAADNVSPNIILSPDSKTGFVAYTGSGVVIAFSTQTGEVLSRIKTGGSPAPATALKDGKTLAFVSVLDNKIFLVNMQSLQLQATYTFANAQFGFGSNLILSPDGTQGYISSTGTGQVIKFSVSDGKESGRLGGVQTPTQLTLSQDGGTLLVVDTNAVELVFADSSSLTRKNTLKPRDSFATASLSMFNRAVLGPDGSAGVLAVRDVSGTLTAGRAFVFKTSTAEVLATPPTGSQPGFTGLTPDGQNWVVLCEYSITVIPSTNPAATQDIPTAQGDPLGSANIVFSPDSKYAFYVSSLQDLFFQHDIATTGVVGQALIGDSPNRALDQPSSVAIGPDGKTLAVLEFIGNKIDLLTDVTVLASTKFLLSGDRFTGLSLVNLSNSATKFQITALDNYGQAIAADGLTNPLELDLAPNAQISKNLGDLFAFDLSKEQSGRLSLRADQPQVAGYLTIGQIRATWLGYFLNGLDGVPLLRDELYDWVVPEIGRVNGESVLLNIVNSNYSAQSYDLSRYSQDGTLIDQKTGQSAPLTNRLEQVFSDQFPSTGESKVLITGGQSSTSIISSAENYDVVAGTFAATGSMTAARQGHTATLLLDGRVLVAGGKDSSGALSSAETYSITDGIFSAVSLPMTASRFRHSATLLPSGKVLIAGGQNSISVNNTAETFDPSANTFTATTGTMSAAKDSHTATLLPNGTVLIAGGIDGNNVSKTAEIYDPSTGNFTLTGSMAAARVLHTATLLSSGRVLIAGGFNAGYLGSAEIFDPVSGTFTATKGALNTARGVHTATLLSDGTVLLAGGTNGSVLSSAEIYDPLTDKFTVVASQMTSPRSVHTSTLTGSGKVLLAGGSDGTSDLTTAETFDPSTQAFTATTGAMAAARSAHTATLLQTGTEGYLLGHCKPGLMFTEYYGAARDSAALNGIEISRFAGVTRLLAPQFATTSGFRTILNIVNANINNDAQVTITLHGADGKVLGTPFTRTVVRNGQLKDDLVNIFQSDPAILDTTGWLEVKTSVDRVVGTVTYTNTDGTIIAAMELRGTPLSRFVFPVAAEDNTYQTGVALLNSGDQAANVTVELWGPGGTLDRTTSINLPPGTRVVQYLSDYFPKLDPYLVANVRISSDQPIHGYAVMNDRALHFLTPIPPIAIPDKP